MQRKLKVIGSGLLVDAEGEFNIRCWRHASAGSAGARGCHEECAAFIVDENLVRCLALPHEFTGGDSYPAALGVLED